MGGGDDSVSIGGACKYGTFYADFNGGEVDGGAGYDELFLESDTGGADLVLQRVVQ